MTVEGRLRLYALAAGLCDGVTGLLLVIAPLGVLRLLGVDDLPAEPVYLRFVGTFVGAVGACYFLPLLAPGSDPSARRVRLAAVFDATALIRLAVAAFVIFAIVRGLLEGAWGTVAATDAVFAVVQVVLRRRFLSRS